MESLARPLALAGLVIGAELYFLLIRRRRRVAEEEAARVSEESIRKSIRRLRHLRRRDED